MANKLREPLLSRLARHFFKNVYPMLPHHSQFARCVRSRALKRFCKTMEELNGVYKWFSVYDTIFHQFDADSEWLFLGGSHAQTGIAPCALELDKGWNAGADSADLRMDYYSYDALRKVWPARAGQLVCLCLSPYSLCFQNEFTPWYASSLYLHRVIDMSYRCKLFMAEPERLLNLALTIVHAEGYDGKNRGFFPKPDASLALKKEDVFRRASGHLRIAKYKPTERVWLERLYEAVAADGRQLVLLYTPLREDYREIYTKAGGKYIIDTSDMPLIKQLDCHEWVFDKDDWHDTDHFRPQGARHFTERLEPELRAMLARGAI